VQNDPNDINADRDPDEDHQKRHKIRDEVSGVSGNRCNITSRDCKKSKHLFFSFLFVFKKGDVNNFFNDESPDDEADEKNQQGQKIGKDRSDHRRNRRNKIVVDRKHFLFLEVNLAALSVEPPQLHDGDNAARATSSPVWLLRATT
jgi:hypothetical protein